ncbi:MAG: hypothetical protein AB1646_11170 [Thermodesulfobacteriota bacterium]
MDNQVAHPSVETHEAPLPRSPAKKAALRSLITSAILLAWAGATAVSLDLYTSGTLMFWGLLYYVALYYFLRLALSLIDRRWLKGLLLVVTIPVGLFSAPLVALWVGLLTGKVHAWKAQEALAPVLEYVDGEIRNTGAAPADIEPGLMLVADRSRLENVWYRPDKDAYGLRVWVASFRYMSDSFPIVTAYSSRERAWTGGQGRSISSTAAWEGATAYYYDASKDRWKAAGKAD